MIAHSPPKSSNGVKANMNALAKLVSAAKKISGRSVWRSVADF